MNPGPEIRCLSVTPIFPGAASPEEGVFVLKRQAALPARIRVDVVRARPWFPLVGLLRPHLGDRPRTERVGSLEVVDLRYLYTPRYGKARDGLRLERALRRHLRDSGAGFDLLDAHFAFPTGHAVVRTARDLGVPSVVTLRGTMPAYLKDARRGPIIETLRGATRVIAVSSSLAAAAREAAGADLDVRVIGNGVDTAHFWPGDRAAARAALGLPADRELLLTVGGLVPRKGAQRVIEALPGLVARHPDLLYLVVGGGGAEGDFEDELKARVRALGLGDRVRLCGRVAPERLGDWYRAADAFVLASSNEGWANALQEALACGVPVVATDVGGNAEVVGGERHGRLVPLGDAAALTAALDEVLSADLDRAAIASWGQRRDWRAVGEEVARVYDEAFASR